MNARTFLRTLLTQPSYRGDETKEFLETIILATNWGVKISVDQQKAITRVIQDECIGRRFPGHLRALLVASAINTFKSH